MIENAITYNEYQELLQELELVEASVGQHHMIRDNYQESKDSREMWASYWNTLHKRHTEIKKAIEYFQKNSPEFFV